MKEKKEEILCRIINMNFDPIYLSEEASLGVLSADGNFCTRIVAGCTKLSQEKRNLEILDLMLK